MKDLKVSILFPILVSMFNMGASLECYVCSNQEESDMKCQKSIMTCEPGEDMCLTEIKWGTMPYWQAGADKQFYISKACATQSQCEKTISKYMPYCTHIWYEDWKCAECCRGDKCNYFIISGSSTVTSNFYWTIGGCLLGIFFLKDKW